jgi:hypothetical protein
MNICPCLDMIVLALVYFHRANRIKSGQQTCLDGIRKATDILQCTICNTNNHLSMTIRTNSFKKMSSVDNDGLLNRPVIRRRLPSIPLPLTNYNDREVNRLLAEIGQDRQLLVNIDKDVQTSAGRIRFVDMFHLHIVTVMVVHKVSLV